VVCAAQPVVNEAICTQSATRPALVGYEAGITGVSFVIWDQLKSRFELVRLFTVAFLGAVPHRLLEHQLAIVRGCCHGNARHCTFGPWP
jgi:hypothetical protein